MAELPPDFDIPPINPVRPKSSRFQRGNRLGGRKRRSVNKISKSLKEGILAGAASFGSDAEGRDGLAGYLAYCAANFPRQYMMLLGKLLPHVINADITANHGVAVQVVRVSGIPRGCFIGSDGNLLPPVTVEDGPLLS